MANPADMTRLAQLARGLEAAATALPLDHRALSERARELADRLQAAAELASGEAGASSVADAVADAGRLHFDLIKLKVHGGDPAALGIEARLDGLESVASDLESAGVRTSEPDAARE